MQTVQPLSVQPAPAKSTAGKREQAAPPDAPSFRSSMERAGQESAAVKDAQKVEGEQPVSQEGLAQAGEEQVQAATPETAAPDGEVKVMEGLLPLVQLADTQPGEDVPAEEIEAQMAILAALLMQPGGEQPQADLPAELAQDAVTAAQQTVQKDASAAQPVLWQAAVLQDGEQEPSRMEEPLAQPATLLESESTLSGDALRPVATTATAVERQPRERNNNTDTGHASASLRQGTQIPVHGTAQANIHPVADLAAQNGEPLPAPQARQVLADSIFEQIQSAVSTGKQEMFVQLKPESLGGLVIHLAMTEEGIKAQVRTSSENVQHLVTAQITQLEDALRARNIPMVQMDVIFDQSAGSGFLHQQRQAWQESGGRGQGSLVAPIEEAAGLYEAALAADPLEALGEGGVEYSA